MGIRGRGLKEAAAAAAQVFLPHPNQVLVLVVVVVVVVVVNASVIFEKALLSFTVDIFHLSSSSLSSSSSSSPLLLSGETSGDQGGDIIDGVVGVEWVGFTGNKPAVRVEEEGAISGSDESSSSASRGDGGGGGSDSSGDDDDGHWYARLRGWHSQPTSTPELVSVAIVPSELLTPYFVLHLRAPNIEQQQQGGEKRRNQSKIIVTGVFVSPVLLGEEGEQ
jgi:hypothetical protein